MRAQGRLPSLTDLTEHKSHSSQWINEHRQPSRLAYNHLLSISKLRGAIYLLASGNHLQTSINKQATSNEQADGKEERGMELPWLASNHSSYVYVCKREFDLRKKDHWCSSGWNDQSMVWDELAPFIIMIINTIRFSLRKWHSIIINNAAPKMSWNGGSYISKWSPSPQRLRFEIAFFSFQKWKIFHK